MKKRIAYVGLSTPVGYDYTNNASKTTADMMSSPNPLLDSPFGLFLLFDEIWFLTRSLCPENLRKSQFVKFLDEINLVPFINSKYCETIKKEIEEQDSAFYNKTAFEKSGEFSEVVNRLSFGRNFGIDNHTHELQIGDAQLRGNPDLRNLLFDMEVMNRINNDNLELITNTFTESWLENIGPTYKQAELAEALIIDNIPNYLSLEGPYHPCVEEARDNEYLKYFRKWIANKPLHSNRKELIEIKGEVEEAIRKAQDDIFLKHLNPRNHYKSVGKSIIGDVAGIFLPGVSVVGSIYGETSKFFSNKDRRWQGFIVSMRNNSKS